MVVSLNSLDGEAAAAFSAFWGVIFVVGPGFFLPLEQEVGRAIAHRRAQGAGGGPLVHRAARLGGLITVLLIVGCILAVPLLNEYLFHDDMLFLPALVVALVGFYVMHLTRGVLAGQGRFGAYGRLLAAEGVIRLGGAICLALAGVAHAGAYALVLGVAPFFAAAFALWRERGLIEPGPVAPYSELSASLGWLLLGSVLMQALAYSPLLGVNILSGPEQAVLVAGFASAFFVARLPVLAFQAVQGTLLPKLAGLAGGGRHDEFRQGLKRLLVAVCGVALAGVAGAFLLGPWVGNLLFKDFSLGAVGLALLAAGSGAFIIALTLAQAIVALGGHRIMSAAWSLGLLVAVGVMAGIGDLERSVELGYLAGACVAAVAMGLAMRSRIASSGTASVESLIEAIEHEPMEI